MHPPLSVAQKSRMSPYPRRFRRRGITGKQQEHRQNQGSTGHDLSTSATEHAWPRRQTFMEVQHSVHSCGSSWRSLARWFRKRSDPVRGAAIWADSCRKPRRRRLLIDFHSLPESPAGGHLHFTPQIQQRSAFRMMHHKAHRGRNEETLNPSVSVLSAPSVVKTSGSGLRLRRSIPNPQLVLRSEALLRRAGSEIQNRRLPLTRNPPPLFA